MSGDIGDGATRAAIKLGQKVLAANLPGYVQLAGGTNGYTVEKLKSLGLLNLKNSDNLKSNGRMLEGAGRSLQFIAGVAYGSYARVLLSPVLDQLEKESLDVAPKTSTARLEANVDLLWQAVGLASSLVSQLKTPMKQKQVIST